MDVATKAARDLYGSCMDVATKAARDLYGSCMDVATKADVKLFGSCMDVEHIRIFRAGGNWVSRRQAPGANLTVNKRDPTPRPHAPRQRQDCSVQPGGPGSSSQMSVWNTSKPDIRNNRYYSLMLVPKTSGSVALKARGQVPALSSPSEGIRFTSRAKRKVAVFSLHPYGREVFSEPADPPREFINDEEVASFVDRIMPLPGSERSAEANPRGGRSTSEFEDEPRITYSVPAFQPVAVPEPELKLISRFKNPSEQNSWGQFTSKCAMAWDVFFPSKPVVLSPAEAMKSRLQVILVSDRDACMSVPFNSTSSTTHYAAPAPPPVRAFCDLVFMCMQMEHVKASREQVTIDTCIPVPSNSIINTTHYAHSPGPPPVRNFCDLMLMFMRMERVKMERVKANGERVTMNLPLGAIPDSDNLRDSRNYHYEEGAGGDERWR
eukprot:gene13931-19862_t